MSTAVHVVGGVYREQVRHPRRDEIYGSGGRAAAVIAALGTPTVLHTAVDARCGEVLDALAASFGFDLQTQPINETTSFTYDHPLGSPKIRPIGAPSLKQPIEVRADGVVVFGMIEAEARVTAKRAVLDPQNPLSPRWLDSHSVGEAVYVLNLQEGRALTGKASPRDVAEAIAARDGVHACVIKLGARGALVKARGAEVRHVPCYETPSVWPIGSGDVFAAALGWAWLSQGMDVPAAAEAASRAVALYAAETGVIPSEPSLIVEADKFPYRAVVPRSHETGNKHDVYLAGPFFSLQDEWLIEEVRDVLQGSGLRVFSPLHDVGHGEAEDVAPQDLGAILDCAVVLALLDRLDPGTLFEIGYARARGIPVVAHTYGVSSSDLKMVQGSDCQTFDDLTTAIYHAIWKGITA